MHPKQEKRAEACANLDRLPPEAYAVLPGRDQLIQLRRGQCGYWPVPERERDRPLEDVAASMNAMIGVTPDEAEAMLNGSLFGWHVPAADPAEIARLRESRA